ncbi:MAG: cell division protein ZapA [Treponema sp.]|jgi:cell division protein ZapA (FtsZ GTPase activity inhibitor)|nr:cell division protein ZapA [Treponema sp.]
MPESVFRLDILGTSFSITTDEDRAYLENILEQYRTNIENIQNISGLKDPLKIAVLTGFSLSDEILRLRMELRKKAEAPHEDEAGEIERRALGLIAKIDQVLKNSGND